jgi:hypothetical protein
MQCLTLQSCLARLGASLYSCLTASLCRNEASGASSYHVWRRLFRCAGPTSPPAGSVGDSRGMILACHLVGLQFQAAEGKCGGGRP